MAEIFGLDIATLVWDAIQSAGGLTEGILRHQPIAEAAEDSAGYDLPEKTLHTFHGLLEDRTIQLDGSGPPVGIPRLTIIGNSIDPPVVPATQDEVEIDGRTCTLVHLVSRDPASAVYQFHVTYP